MNKPKPQATIDHAAAIAELETRNNAEFDQALEGYINARNMPEEEAILRNGIARLRARQITPEQAADILTSVFKGSINRATREQLEKLRGEMPRPAREKLGTRREELLEAAHERIRWCEQDAGKSFAVIHGAIDHNRKMQVSLVESCRGDFLLMLEAARVLWHEAHGYDVIPEPDPPNLGCELPPLGWYCSREPGHDGPCAARRTG
jgi:hypothetical protein